ncbi:EKA-like protein [Blumeria hordei DH14]|uniref:EKA-like protein n=1 Tax=Blumeria graminis f. sp. hordei (strain DH14) TaxID=546991 RepID=N1JK96_BLUG1|nr:EKA-like protein [Blumeria hordei DH14]
MAQRKGAFDVFYVWGSWHEGHGSTELAVTGIFIIPPVRKKRPNAKLDNTRVRPRALEKPPGLAQSPKCAEMSKVSTKGKEKALSAVAEPDTDMIGSVEILEEIPQPSSIPHGVGESSKPPPTEPKPSEKAPPKAAPIKESQPQAATKAECPPELRPIVEAEQRRAAETAANLALCSAAISSVEATLFPLTNGSNRKFVDSMRVYLRAAIAQYMATGPGSTPSVLPPRPANPIPRAPDPRSQTIPAVPVLPVKSTWATVARNGLPQKAVPKAKAVPQPAAKAQNKKSQKAKVDKRLFLRLEKEHPWLKERLLEAAPRFSEFNAELEEASNLVAFRIPNFPVTIKTIDGIMTVDAGRISLEIYRKTHRFPLQMRPHGICRPGAPYRNWKALFTRDHAPRLGFRILDEAGAATIYKPRPQIEQCKCCLGFHATRALTKYRHCRGPHRSDSMIFQARPKKSGPVTKEQLAWIHHIEQGEFTKVARARAAAKRAEEAIIAAAKDVPMAEATGLEFWNLKEFENTVTSKMSLLGHLLINSRIPAGSKAIHEVGTNWAVGKVTGNLAGSTGLHDKYITMPPAAPNRKQDERTKRVKERALNRKEMIKKAKHLVRSKIDPRDAQYYSLNYENLERDIFNKMEIDGETEP